MNKMSISCLAVLLSVVLITCSLNKYNVKDEKMIFEFPKLTGPYKVGYTTRHIVDQTRQEPFNPTEKRELMVHLWYPADIKDTNPLEVYQKVGLENRKEKCKQLNYSQEYISCLDSIFCHAIADAPLIKSNRQFPIVIFSHGYATHPLVYTALCEELASNGYIVISVSHTYYAIETVFPDGRNIPALLENLQRWPNSDDFKIWIDDVKCTIDYIEQINSDTSDNFVGFFDITKIGMFGHSYGGAVSFEMCAFDSRIKTGIALDVGLYGKATLEDMHKPFMFIMGEESIINLSLSNEDFAQKFSQPVELVKKVREDLPDDGQIKFAKELNLNTNPACVIIPKLAHGGFSDYLILKEFKLPKSNEKYVMLTGPAEGFSTMRLLNNYIVTFFDKYLKGVQS